MILATRKIRLSKFATRFQRPELRGWGNLLQCRDPAFGRISRTLGKASHFYSSNIIIEENMIIMKWLQTKNVARQKIKHWNMYVQRSFPNNFLRRDSLLDVRPIRPLDYRTFPGLRMRLDNFADSRRVPFKATSPRWGHQEFSTYGCSSKKCFPF